MLAEIEETTLADIIVRNTGIERSELPEDVFFVGEKQQITAIEIDTEEERVVSCLEGQEIEPISTNVDSNLQGSNFLFGQERSEVNIQMQKDQYFDIVFEGWSNLNLNPNSIISI